MKRSNYEVFVLQDTIVQQNEILRHLQIMNYQHFVLRDSSLTKWIFSNERAFLQKFTPLRMKRPKSIEHRVGMNYISSSGLPVQNFISIQWTGVDT